MKYPVTRRENIVDVIHGTEIADPSTTTSSIQARNPVGI
jgi:hypothetical protein